MKIILNEMYSVKVTPVHFGPSSTISGQDYDIGELIQRWSQGQRLNVHMRPIEYETESNKDEAFKGDMLPQFEDIVEMKEYQQAHESRKTEFIERIKANRMKKNDDSDKEQNTEQREVDKN